MDNNRTNTSAALISVCTIISRITGFGRTWAMAFALGATFIASSYQVANNLPNMLFELVAGGMLSTAFLPVYLSVKKRQGQAAGNDYASNLLTLTLLFLGGIAVLCIIFSAEVIYSQSFYSNQDEMKLSVFFFRFFAIQVVFYGASSIVSGLLNANRDYLWGAIAPVANNIIVIATFLVYAFCASNNPQLAFYVIAIGNPLGVFVQMALQLPALKRNGIHLRFRLNLRDPALRETWSIGGPALFVTVCSFVTISVMNAASYCFADNGPSVIAYSRLWFTLPWSFLAIPVATALFTELSDMQADNNIEGVISAITNGCAQIFFLMMPCTLYLIAFATPLVTLYHIGAFSSDAIAQIATYLCVLAVALPFYGVNTYLQMVFSSIRKMTAFSVINLVAALIQIAIIAGAVWGKQLGLPFTLEYVAWGTVAMYAICDIVVFIYLRKLYRTSKFSLLPVSLGALRGLGLGFCGAAVGSIVYYVLQTTVGVLSGNILQALIYLLISGTVALAVTFIPAVKLHLPEAEFVSTISAKLLRVILNHQH